MATVTITIPDTQVARVKAAVVSRSSNVLGPVLDPSTVTNAAALTMLQDQLRDYVRNVVASYERDLAIASVSVDASAVVA